MTEVTEVYNYFRDFDPSIGRYVQSDPIGLKGGINNFGYVEGNPVGSFDFLGLLTGYHHRHITMDARIHTNAALSCNSLAGLPAAVAGVDKGTQGIEYASTHHMRPKIRDARQDLGGEDPRIMRKAMADIKSDREKAMGSCNFEGLATALHQVQDGKARGHRNMQEYIGDFRGIPLVNPITHGLGDLFPSAKTRTEAVQVSIDTINEFLRRCPCFCK